MKRLKLWLIPMMIGMMLITAFVYPMDREVMIETDGETITVMTRAHTVKQLLEELNIIIAEYDHVTPGPEVLIEDQMLVSILRAIPVRVEVDGNEEVILTTHSTVKDLLDSMDVTLGQDDRVEPALMSLLKPDTRIKVSRVTKIYKNDILEIPPQRITRFTDTLEPGVSQVVQTGEPGIMMVRRAHLTVDGEPGGMQLLETRVLLPAVDYVTEQGREKLVMTKDGALKRYKEVYTMTATAYDAGFQSTGKHPGHPAYGITRSGTRVRPGVVAVDPRVIPLGTTLYVESMDSTACYGISYAEDTGGAIKGNRIDLYYESRADALRFGRRQVRVYVLEDE